RGTRRSPIYLNASVGLVPGAARAEIGALDELVLQLPDVGVLRRELHLVGLAPHDLLDAVARFLERRVLGATAELDHRREGACDLRRRIGPRDVNGDALRLGVAETRGLAAVVVLERDDDVGLVRLAHDRDREAEPARRFFDSRPRETERVDLHRLAPAVRGDAGGTAVL